MEYDESKVDDMVLALLFLTMHEDRYGSRAWKSHDWGVMDRLCEKGYILDPKNTAKSVAMTEEGARRAQALFEQHFAKVHRSSEGG
jgi:hypothetical protein